MKRKTRKTAAQAHTHVLDALCISRRAAYTVSKHNRISQHTPHKQSFFLSEAQISFYMAREPATGHHTTQTPQHRRRAPDTTQHHTGALGWDATGADMPAHIRIQKRGTTDLIHIHLIHTAARTGMTGGPRLRAVGLCRNKDAC